MNAMVQEMSWDTATNNKFSELNSNEVDQISGGSPLFQHTPEILAFSAAVVAVIKALRS